MCALRAHISKIHIKNLLLYLHYLLDEEPSIIESTDHVLNDFFFFFFENGMINLVLGLFVLFL